MSFDDHDLIVHALRAADLGASASWKTGSLVRLVVHNKLTHAEEEECRVCKPGHQNCPHQMPALAEKEITSIHIMQRQRMREGHSYFERKSDCLGASARVAFAASLFSNCSNYKADVENMSFIRIDEREQASRH